MKYILTKARMRRHYNNLSLSNKVELKRRVRQLQALPKQVSEWVESVGRIVAQGGQARRAEINQSHGVDHE